MIDNAHCLRAETIKTCNRAIAVIYDACGKDMVVETFAKIPADLQKEYKFDPRNPDPFFKEWCKYRRDDLEVKGLYLLICMDPLYCCWTKNDRAIDTEMCVYMYKLIGRGA